MRNYYFLLVLSVFMLLAGTESKAQNYALKLDGENDFIGVSDNAALNPTSALTVEAWIKADKWESGIYAGVIVGKQATNPDRGYCLTVGENGRAEFTLSIDGHWEAVSTPAIMGLNVWYHLAGVYDGSSLKLYINGNLQNTLNISSGNHDPSTGSVMRLGDNPTWTGRNFEGCIDEIRIWETARSASEILDNFTTELTGSETGLSAYWKFNEGSGNTTADATANALEGTLLNMDLTTAWVEGFQLPGKDVGVIGIVSPYKIGPAFTSSETIKVEIKNFSAEAVSGFDISYELDGAEPVTELVSAEIPPFGSYVYSFSGTEDLSGQESCELKAYTNLTNDVNNLNDVFTEIISPAENAMIFDDEQHSFSSAGQTHYATLYINEDLSNYKQVLLNIDLNCPTGGCDPWDQPAFLYIVHEGIKYEIARYITPYGIACGNWTFDITDFKSILKGSVKFQSYIQVWGATGWLLDAELVLVPGTPVYASSTIEPLCVEEYWVYGDTQANPHNPPAKTVSVDPDADALKIRMTTTGHGQGNTDNAAEFKEVNHEIWLNNQLAFTQHLWKGDCDQNECSPQNGTWTYARAGWCPGQDVQPMEWDLNGLFTAGEDLTFEYKLQDYTNYNNTGYNNGSHTEPHYKICTYLVSYFNPTSDVHNSTTVEKGVDLYPNPATNTVYLKFGKSSEAKLKVDIYNISGQFISRKILDNVKAGEVYALPLTNLLQGLYTVKISSKDFNMSRKLIVNK